jgi:hypothetical protein
MSEVEDSLSRIYEEHATLLHFLGQTNVPAPPALALTAEFAINASLRRALEADRYDAAEIARLLRRAEMDNVKLDAAMLNYAADGRMKRAMVSLERASREQKISVMAEALAIAESLRGLPGRSNLWQAQNIWHDLLLRSAHQQWRSEWHEAFMKLGTALKIEVQEFVLREGVFAA